MNKDDYAGFIETSRNRQLLLDKLFLEIAVFGDEISISHDSSKTKLSEKMGELTMCATMALGECITMHSMCDVLLAEKTRIPEGGGTVGMLNNLPRLLTFMDEYPLFETLECFLDNRLSMHTLNTLVTTMPPLTVDLIMESPPLSKINQTLTDVGECLETQELQDIPCSAPSIVVTKLTTASQVKIGITDAVPEMVLIRFIENYVSIYMSLLNTILTFKAI